MGSSLESKNWGARREGQRYLQFAGRLQLGRNLMRAGRAQGAHCVRNAKRPTHQQRPMHIQRSRVGDFRFAMPAAVDGIGTGGAAPGTNLR
jgi:hypothetical protein